jgi:hypothetical protein
MESTVQAALIAGVVALVGSALSNFGAEMYKRRRDAAALAGGLAGELKAYESGIFQLIDALPTLIEVTQGGHNVRFPRLQRPRSPIYESRVGDLGLLGPKLAERITFVHGLIDTFRSGMEAAIAPDVTPQEQNLAFKAALSSIRQAKEAAMPLITDLHKFLAREPFEPL